MKRTLPLWLQAAVISSCMAAVVPAKTWAQQAEPSEQLTRLFMPGTSTVYSFNYPTINTAGERIVLSSALIAWTPTDDRQESTLPRRNYKELLDDKTAAYVGRCIIIAPDYEGYGVTKDLPHPYLSQRLTAQQVLDAVDYGLELYRKQAAEKSADNPLLPIKSDWRMFGLGYSQGAAVTLAWQRLIEEKGLAEQLHFYGSICGDGPYDLIETMRYYFNDDGTSYNVETDHRKGISTYPVVVPLITARHGRAQLDRQQAIHHERDVRAVVRPAAGRLRHPRPPLFPGADGRDVLIAQRGQGSGPS